MAQEFHSSKKCPNCGHWSDWKQLPTDTCQHCGTLLHEDFLRNKEEAAEKKSKKQFEIDLIEIYPTDHPLLKIGKHIVRALQISFVAVVSFILWLIALIAG